MRGLGCIFIFSISWLGVFGASASEWEAKRNEAETFFAEGSYEKARVIYSELAGWELPKPDHDWVRFRLADTSWRSAAATEQSDPALIELHRDALKELSLRLFQESPADLPELWLQVEMSLGDSYWLNQQWRDWSMAILHYNKVLNWWAGQTDIEPARKAYLDLVKRMVWLPQVVQGGTSHGRGHFWISQAIVNNVVTIAKADEDIVWTQYLLARHLETQQGNPSNHVRMQEAYEKALAKAEGTEWYDDVLYHFARWQQRGGKSTYNEQGVFVYRPDFEKAIELYQRLLANYGEAESSYVNDTKRQIERLTQSSLDVYVHHVFQPGEAVDFAVKWKNLPRVTVQLYPVILDQIQVGSKESGHSSNWYKAVAVDAIEPVRIFEFTTEEGNRFYREEREVQIDEGLPLGTYIVEASADGHTERNYIQVTQSAMVGKIDDTHLVAYYCDASSGQPIGNAPVHLWARISQGAGSPSVWSQQTSTTNDNGIAVFEFANGFDERFDYWVGAQAPAKGLAFTRGHYYARSNWEFDEVYVFTDRPAYRPAETVRWKGILQSRIEGDAYRVLSDLELDYRVLGPRGTVYQSGTLVSNQYGSVWGEINLDKEWPLGKYRIEFSYQDAGSQQTSRATILFRLEEYKLPEYKVNISTQDFAAKQRSIYRFGDEVKVFVQADYYHGGPVAHAAVEVVVQKVPYFWQPLWESNSIAPAWQPAEDVQRETLKTDEQGQASFILKVPGYQGNDLSFNIEARVVDASRREVFERASIRVTRQPYFVDLIVDRQLYRPGEVAQVTLRSVDANHQPVPAQGRLRVTRETLQEIWVGPEGKEITRNEFEELKNKRSGFFSRSIDPDEYRVIGYKPKTVEVSNIMLGTQENGKASHSFTIKDEGYYRIVWVSYDPTPEPIKVEKSIWVADEGTQQMGFEGELNIIADKDAFKPGSRVPVMLASPTSSRYVFFSTEAHSIIDYQVVHLKGNVQLVEIEVSEKWIPNVFLTATMVANEDYYTDVMEVDIAPVQKQLKVQVAPGDSEYMPQEKGVFDIQVTDASGEPVSAEVAIAVIDEAVYAIQNDLAENIFKHFYGDRRTQSVRTATSFQERPFKQLQSSEDATEMARLRPTDLRARLAMDRGGAEFAGGVQLQRKASADSEFYKEDVTDSALDAPLPKVVVRNDFHTSIFWQPNVVTDAAGRAKIEFDFPDNLTTWQAKARAVADDSRFGEAVATTKTRLPLIARLQIPRFFVVGDQVTVSGVFNNNSDRELLITASLAAEGVQVQGIDQLVKIPAQGMQRVDWIVDVATPGEANITLHGRSQKHSDGMTLTVPIYERGIDKVVGTAAQLPEDATEKALRIDLPGFVPATMDAYVQVSPSLAVTMLDALPYLVEYPYGSTEQTLNRFLPLLMVERTLKNFGIKSKAVLAKMFEGIDEAYLPEMANDFAKRDEMIRMGLERLYDYQNKDGSWGWWQGGPSNLYMSAYALWGLTLCETMDIAVEDAVLEKAREFLTRRLVDAEGDVDLQAWILHALAARFEVALERKPTRPEAKAFANLWKNRDQLNAFTRSLLALSAFYFDFADEGRIVVDNLENGVVRIDPAMGNPAMAHWGNDGVWYHWSEGSIEATAFGLMALTRLEPEHPLIQPVLNWLVLNRRGARWSNTRDTAITLLALNQYLKVSGQLDVDMEYSITVNDAVLTTQSIDPENLLRAPSRFVIPASLLKEGENQVQIKRESGEGALFAAVAARFKTLENPIQPAAHQIQIKRRYNRVTSVPTLLKGYEEKKIPLLDGERIASGERVEVVLEIEGNNDFEFLMLEDLKPSGFEAADIQSGKRLLAKELSRVDSSESGQNETVYTGREAFVYQELRDRKVAMFIDALATGHWEIRYTLRAEVPGVFQVLPAIVQAMYIPDIRSNSDEVKVTVE